MQYKILTALVFYSIGAMVITSIIAPHTLQKFFGNVGIVAISFGTLILGVTLLPYLVKCTGFSIIKMDRLSRLFPFLPLTFIVLGVSIYVDSVILFPEDMNVPLPEALIFYPAIAFIVELVFHIMPIAVLYLLLSLFKSTLSKTILSISFFFIAAIEPTYQIYFMTSESTMAAVTIWINLYLFNLMQLLLFKKFDFVSMYLFRLFYYLQWHIIWGHLRLEFLF